jgi:hypothetical protein
MFNNGMNNGYSLAYIAAASGNNRNNDGFGFDGNGAWIFLLFILLLMGGWNSGNGWGNNGTSPAAVEISNDVQRSKDRFA